MAIQAAEKSAPCFRLSVPRVARKLPYRLSLLETDRYIAESASRPDGARIKQIVSDFKDRFIPVLFFI